MRSERTDLFGRLTVEADISAPPRKGVIDPRARIASPKDRAIDRPTRFGNRDLLRLAGGSRLRRHDSTPITVLAAIEYLHHTPIRRGLARRAVDWKWSRAGYYLLDRAQQDPDLPTVESLPAGWLTEPHQPNRTALLDEPAVKIGSRGT